MVNKVRGSRGSGADIVTTMGVDTTAAANSINALYAKLDRVESARKKDLGKRDVSSYDSQLKRIRREIRAAEKAEREARIRERKANTTAEYKKRARFKADEQIRVIRERAKLRSAKGVDGPMSASKWLVRGVSEGTQRGMKGVFKGTKAIGRMGLSAGRMGIRTASVAGLGLAGVGASLVQGMTSQARKEVDSFIASRVMLEGVSKQGGFDVQGGNLSGWVQQFATEMGAGTTQMMKDFAQFMAGRNNLDAGTAQSLFAEVNRLSVARGLEPQDMKRVNRALMQMAAKGTIQMEELKMQLGDAMPGAVALFADAFGMTQEELIKASENRELQTDKYFPLLLKHLEKDTTYSREALKLQLQTATRQKQRAQNLTTEAYARWYEQRGGTQAVGSLWQVVGQISSGLLNMFGDNLTTGINRFASGLMTATVEVLVWGTIIKQVVGDFLTKVFGPLDTALGGFGEALTAFLQDEEFQKVLEFLKTVGNNLAGVLVALLPLFNALWKVVAGLTPALGVVVDVLGSVAEALASFITGFLDGLRNSPFGRLFGMRQDEDYDPTQGVSASQQGNFAQYAQPVSTSYGAMAAAQRYQSQLPSAQTSTNSGGAPVVNVATSGDVLVGKDGVSLSTHQGNLLNSFD